MIDPNLGYASPCAALRDIHSLNSTVAYFSGGEEETLQLEDIVYDDRPGPEDLLYCKELKRLLFAAFRKLTSCQRRVTYLHFRKEHSQTEIAEQLGISRSAVSQALSKSVAKLRLAAANEMQYMKA